MSKTGWFRYAGKTLCGLTVVCFLVLITANKAQANEPVHPLQIGSATASFAYDVSDNGSEFVDPADASAPMISYNSASNTLTFTNCTLTLTGDNENIVDINPGSGLDSFTIVFEGNNNFACTGGGGSSTFQIAGPEDGMDSFDLVINGNTTITRSGGNFALSLDHVKNVTFSGESTLTLSSTADSAIMINNWNGTENREDFVSVFKNTATDIRATSTGDAAIGLWGSDILHVSNSGYIYGTIGLGEYGVFTNMVPYTTHYTERVEHNFKGRAFYFHDPAVRVYEQYGESEHNLTPNNIVGILPEPGVGDAMRRDGQYDAEGFPIVANGFWHYYYFYGESDFEDGWGSSLEEEEYITRFLLYGEPAELDALPNLVTDKVQIDDGKVHVLNNDLRRLSVGCGNVTLNGNILYTLAASSEVEWAGPPDEYGRAALVRDANGVAISPYDSSNSSITVNGDVFELALSDTFKGNVTLNGSSMITSYLWESITPDYEWPRTDAYTAAKNLGSVIVNGQFVAGITPFDGMIMPATYNGEPYSNLVYQEDGEEVHGTQEIIDGEIITVDVSSDGIDGGAFPFVRAVDDTEKARAKDLLGDSSAKIYALGISIVAGNDKTQPGKEINLYLNEIDGFSSPALYHINADGSVEKIELRSAQKKGRKVATVNSFSTYFIAEDTYLSEENPEEPQGEYLDDLRESIREASKNTDDQTLYYLDADTLPYDIMKMLKDNPQITLVLRYRYLGNEYTVTIPGKYAIADENIKWYGPLWMNAHYAKYNGTVPIPAMGSYGRGGINGRKDARGCYIVKPNDTLWSIAVRFKTTVKALVELNGIKNPNLIFPHQKIYY